MGIKVAQSRTSPARVTFKGLATPEAAPTLKQHYRVAFFKQAGNKIRRRKETFSIEMNALSLSCCLWVLPHPPSLPSAAFPARTPRC